MADEMAAVVATTSLAPGSYITSLPVLRPGLDRPTRVASNLEMLGTWTCFRLGLPPVAGLLYAVGAVVRRLAGRPKEKKRELRDVVLAESPDEEAIRQVASELGASLGEAAVMASGFVAEARTILTPEQVDTLMSFKASKDEAVDELFGQLRQGIDVK